MHSSDISFDAVDLDPSPWKTETNLLDLASQPLFWVAKTVRRPPAAVSFDMGLLGRLARILVTLAPFGFGPHQSTHDVPRAYRCLWDNARLGSAATPRSDTARRPLPAARCPTVTSSRHPPVPLLSRAHWGKSSLCSKTASIRRQPKTIFRDREPDSSEPQLSRGCSICYRPPWRAPSRSPSRARPKSRSAHMPSLPTVEGSLTDAVTLGRAPQDKVYRAYFSGHTFGRGWRRRGV